MYEQNTNSDDYFKHNDKRANQVLAKLMFGFIIVWPVLLLLSHFNIFTIPAKDFYLPCILTVLCDIILLLLYLFKAPSYFIKYYCLIALEIVIGITSTYTAFGICILYAVSPVASCVYFNHELTRRISFFGYVMMIIGLVFRTNEMAEYGLTTYSPLHWFLSSAFGYTIEYIVIALVCWAIASRSRAILEDVLARKQKIQSMQQQIIFSFANLIESKDNVTGQHVKRTSAYVKLIANELKYNGFYADELDDSTVECICMAAPIHDIGKIKMPDSILCKPSALTDEEYSYMKTHTVKGEEIIQKTMKNLENEKFLSYASDMALYHHEHWDGSGYPEGLTGQQIPLCARIMAVADVFDALVTSRSYKKPMSIDEAFQKLEEEKGTHFEPLIVDVFVEQKEVVQRIYKDLI